MSVFKSSVFRRIVLQEKKCLQRYECQKIIAHMNVSKFYKHNSIKTISSSCYFSGAWENAHLWGGQTTFMFLLPQYYFFSGAASLGAPWFQCLSLFSSNKFAYRRTHLEKIAQFCYANLSNALDTNIEGREDVVRI